MNPANPAPLRVALYARVSSDRQAQAHTIASQVEALRQRIATDGLTLEAEMNFIDDGCSGSTLVRPALERLRDQAAAGAIDRLYVHSPDRLARRYAYQVLLVEELQHAGVELVFLNHAASQNPEDDLLLQVQGVVAEYERAKILERSRRGKLHAARQGRVSALGHAPYGYRYLSKHLTGGEARFDVLLEEAAVVRDIFRWIAVERMSLNAVARRLMQQGIVSPGGKAYWDRSVIYAMVRNPVYAGLAAYPRRQIQPRIARLRPLRNRPEQPRCPVSHVRVPLEQCVRIPVPAIIEMDVFESVQQQLEENRQRNRASREKAHYLLQGLILCAQCGFAMCGRSRAGGLSYRCIGNGVRRASGQRVCHNRSIGGEELEAAVWEDVRKLLAEPRRIEQEYERRLQCNDPADQTPDAHSLQGQLNKTQRQISRLIDVYGEGLIDRQEFEPRMHAAREHLARLQADLASQNQREAAQQEMRLVIGHLEAFAQRVQAGLKNADWSTRREILCALVKRIEISEQEVRIIYRVGCDPFEAAPAVGGRGQDCWSRVPKHPLRAGRPMIPVPLLPFCSLLSDRVAAPGIRKR
jgi:site-specific DNA recombinase